MRRALWSLLSATLALAFMCGPALAETVTVSPAGEITMASEGNMTFTGRGLMEITTNCPVSFAGSLERSFETGVGSTEGTLTSVTVGTCFNVAVRLIGVPRGLGVFTFLGTGRGARERTGILLTINGLSASVIIMGTECLYRSTNVGLLAALTWVGREALEEYAVSQRKRSLIPVWNLASGGALCPSTLAMSGTFRTSPAQVFRFS